MRVALAFKRHDVDQFLDELDHEQFEEWAALIDLEPTGWQALRVAARRLSYIVAQAHSPKRLRERDYDIVLGGQVRSPDVERARWEAMSVRTEIAQENEERNDG
jgi:hypothetical protein